MLEINKILKENNYKPKKYNKKGNAVIFETNEGKFVIKKNENNIYDYLNSRSFNYYPNTKTYDNYEITDYVKGSNIPNEQKIVDLIELTSLLHNKTTFYKEISLDDYKKIYEDILNNIEYLYNYYNNLITKIDNEIFMSPSNYLLARGINIIFSSLEYSKQEINNWYELVKDNTKQRYTLIHNNLNLDHLIINDNPYLISWNNSKVDFPIYDLYVLYKNHALDFNFEDIFELYEKNYPLKDDEKKLLFVLISLPDLIKDSNFEYERCINVKRLLEYLNRTDKLISPYYSNNTE